MLADSFKLSDLRLAARTRIFDNKFDINFSMLYDPYVWRTDSIFTNRTGIEQILERRVNEYAWQNGQGIGRLKSVNLSISTNFNPKAREAEANNPNTMRGIDGNPLPPGSIDPATGLPVEMNNFSNDMSPEMAHLYTNPNEYVDFNIPWSLRLMYNINWNRSQSSGRATALEPNITQTIRTSGDVNITDKWKIGFSTGWDFTQKEITQTDIRIFRDLHCWEMNLNWTPFGRFTSYSMDIRVKASVLRDLKYNRRRSFWDN